MDYSRSGTLHQSQSLTICDLPLQLLQINSHVVCTDKIKLFVFNPPIPVTISFLEAWFKVIDTHGPNCRQLVEPDL